MGSSAKWLKGFIDKYAPKLYDKGKAMLFTEKRGIAHVKQQCVLCFY